MGTVPGYFLCHDHLSKLRISSSNPDEYLSRQPKHDWVQLCEAEKEDHNSRGKLAKSIIGVKDSDFEIMTKCVIEIIHCLEWPQKKEVEVSSKLN